MTATRLNDIQVEQLLRTALEREIEILIDQEIERFKEQLVTRVGEAKAKLLTTLVTRMQITRNPGFRYEITFSE